MKKIVCILSVFLLVIITCFVGCQDNSDDVSGTESSVEMGDGGQDGTDILVSDNKLSLEVQIGTDVYAFPMKYETFLSYGWVYEGDDTVEIEPNDYLEVTGLKKDDLNMQIAVINLNEEKKSITECYVGGITLKATALLNAEDIKIYLPRGFECFSATANEVRAEYGTPDYDETLEDGSVLIEYEYGATQVIRFQFDEGDSLLSELEIKNMVLPEE